MPVSQVPGPRSKANHRSGYWIIGNVWHSNRT